MALKLCARTCAPQSPHSAHTSVCQRSAADAHYVHSKCHVRSCGYQSVREQMWSEISIWALSISILLPTTPKWRRRNCYLIWTIIEYCIVNKKMDHRFRKTMQVLLLHINADSPRILLLFMYDFSATPRLRCSIHVENGIHLTPSRFSIPPFPAVHSILNVWQHEKRITSRISFAKRGIRTSTLPSPKTHTKREER